MMSIEDIDDGLKAVKVKWRNNLKTTLEGICGESGLYAQSQLNVQHFITAVKEKEEVPNFINMTDSDLSIIFEKFIYLNTCPGIFKPWILFYMDLFQNQPPHMIILILNRIQLGPNGKHNLKWKDIARKLFEKVTTSFSLNFKVTEHNFHALDGFSKKLKGLREKIISKFLTQFVILQKCYIITLSI